MKRLISVLISLAVLVASIFVIPAQATESADNTSADVLASLLGATNANLVLSEDFSNSSFADRVSYRDDQAANVEQFEVKDGKWYIQSVTNKALSNKNGWTQKALGDFIATFEFTPRICGWGQSQFFYHSATGQPGQYSYDIYFKPVENAKKYAISLMEKSTGNTVSTDPMVLTVDQPYNVAIVSKGLVDSLYFWKVGDAIPTAPIVTLTKSAKVTGDMYYYAYNDKVAIDDIKVYDLTTVSPENMEKATGHLLNDKNNIYKNDFTDATEAPVGKFGAYTGTSEIVNGKWQVTGEIGTSKGIAGKTDIKNFAYGFQLAVTDATKGYYADIAYHSTTGWANSNGFNRLNLWENGSGNLVFGLYAKEGASQSVTTAYVQGDLLNIVMTYVDGTVSAYIWKLGEDVPTSATLSVSGTVETSGDFYFHLAKATFTLDNFFAYDLTDKGLYPEHIEKATGMKFDKEKLIYQNDFESATEAPVGKFTAYTGTSGIADEKWQVVGQIGTSTGLAKKANLKNFAYGFQFAVTDATKGYYADIAYHSTTGWANSNGFNRLNIWENGSGNLVFGLYAKDEAKQSVTTAYVQGDLLNIVMTYVDGTASAYIWKAGDTVPTTPTLSVSGTVATSGDLYFHLANATFTFDNFYVYDITADDSDGVYTNMESSYQMESTFKGLPKTIETTIKMPTVFTGGAGNTIIGNHKYENYVFSFEINENGNPYVAFDPPWKQRRVIEFTDVDVRTGEWLNLAITTDIVADTVSCYVNGELKQTLDIPKHPDPVLESNTDFLDYDIGSEMYIGRDMRGAYDKYYFKGKIKTLTMFSDIRTAEEIAADMNGVAADADALIADYCFDGCYGTSVADRSANSYDLINVGYMNTEPEAPSDYAYSFAVVGDTQILTRVYPEKLSCIYDWIVENKDSQKIEYVMGLGDITDKDTDNEWKVASAEISKLNAAGIPYSLVRGNHDSEYKFNTYLADIYPSQIDGFYGSINNSYKIFTVGEVDYLLINLNMGAIDDELLWAEELIKTHPNHNVIITTHIYLDSDGTRIDDYGTVPATTCRENANNGDDIWDKLISKYSNISLVMSGHVSSTEVLVKRSEGANGNIVTEMLIDPQSTDESSTAGPAGLVTMLYFSEDGKNVQVRNYSTVRDLYYGPQNQFDMTLDTVEYTYGDINDDAKTDIMDLIRFKKALAKVDVKINFRTANINKDATVDALDLAELNKMLLSKVS